MISRHDLLRRIRYSKAVHRVHYDLPPPPRDSGDDLIDTDLRPDRMLRHPPEKPSVKASKQKPYSRPPGETGMSGKTVIFDHLAQRVNSDDPEVLMIHTNNYIDQNRMHSLYNQHMRDNGFEMHGPSRESSAHYTSRRAMEQSSPEDVLGHQADFLEMHNKVDHFREHINNINIDRGPEPGEEI